MRKVSIALSLVFVGALASSLFAVAKVEWPLAKAWGTSQIVIGTVTARNDDNMVLTVKITALPKEAKDFAVGDTLKVRVTKPETLYPQIANEQPIVFFFGAKDVIAHVADEWCLLKPLTSAKTYNIAGLHDKFRGTFPGRTADLLRAIEEMKTGKSTLLDAAPPKLLSVQEKVEAVADVKATLEAIEDSKGAMQNIHNGLSMTAGNFGPAGERCYLSLTKTGLLREAVKATPATSPATSAGSASADDDVRLLGSSLLAHVTEWKEGVTDGRIFTADVNGDGRDDAVIVSTHGTLLLLNRGFGAFLVVKLDGDAFKDAMAVKADAKSGGLLVLRKLPTGAEFWRASTPAN